MGDNDAISTIGVWHITEPLLCVASYSPDRGGSVTIFDDTGECIPDVNFATHQSSQATALRWHPHKILVVSGWENGEIQIWSEGKRDFATVNGPHKCPIVLLEFSEHGGRMVTVDSMGMLTGWRCDSSGNFLTMFSHDLKDSLLHITFRRTVQNTVEEEINQLAKAAVAGDEIALDVLTNWRPRTAARNLSHSGVQDNHCFYVGTQTGILYYLNQSGTCTEVLKTRHAPIVQVLWHPKRDAIVVLMEDMTVGHYLVESSGSLTELDRVKLSGRISGQNGAISWASNSLAIITGDLNVRIWDIDTSENFLLPLELITSSSSHTNVNGAGGGGDSTPSKMNHLMPHKIDLIPSNGPQPTEVFTCIAYCADNQTLCSGTNQGNLYTWKRTNCLIDGPENTWQLNNISTVRGAIKQCIWGVTETAKPCIMLNCISNVYILKEHPLIAKHIRNVWAVQLSANQICLQFATDDNLVLSTMVASDLSISDLCISEKNLILTNGRTIVTYKLTKDVPNDQDDNKQKYNAKILNSFGSDSLETYIYDQSIIVLTQSNIKILSLSGVLLQEIHFSDAEGKPIGADLNGPFLTTFTLNGVLKVFNVSRHEPKIMAQPKSGHDLFNNFGEIIMAKCNANGTHLGITIANEGLMPDGKIYVWDFENDRLAWIDLMAASNLTGARVPIEFTWDRDDGRLMACKIRSLQSQQTNRASKIESTGNGLSNETNTETQIMTLFVTDKCDMRELETIGLLSDEKLVDLCAPYVVILKYGAINRQPLRDFVGLENCDAATRKMVLDFSLNVAIGNMDVAFQCIRSLESEAVWNNLAKKCVQTRRLDVAKVCLGHLKKARSVRALRQAMDDPSLEEEAKVAVLAIELGMLTEAESLYKKCNRYDLLNRLLQASGKYDEAIQVAEQCDRVHLKNSYFKYAEWLRDHGDVKGAICFFTKSSNSTHSISQMLLEDPLSLRKFMQQTDDNNLLRWWGQYIESTQDLDGALKVYQKAQDFFSQVRVLCYLGQVQRADSIARTSRDQAACCHLARHYENVGKIHDAIQFYATAKTFGNAIRLCKENDLRDDLWNIANLAPAKDKAIAAAYFEECEDYKRAVELYHRAGQLHKAVEMAFISQQPETLQVIASELNADSDPELITRCVDFFLEIEQAQKAVQLLANAKEYEQALKICGERAIPITESLVELLTPHKDEVLHPEVRNNILIALGDILQEQGDYHAATKKFTQGGDKIKAMKSLLKSGDTDKVIFFAGMSRQREVYVMAANYLQALNWQNDPKILKHIVTFYTKGQAFDSLANFYVYCAQVEIDEYRDYVKALKALNEALRCLSKVPNSQRAEDNLNSMIREVQQVLEIQGSLERGEYQRVIAGCKNMLGQPEQRPIRLTDVEAMLIEAFVNTKQCMEALGGLKDLAQKIPDWSSRRLVERSTVERIAKECDTDFESLWNSGKRKIHLSDDSRFDGGENDEEYEEIQEEVDA